NIDGQVVLYADKMTGSLIRALKETDRRRKKQIAYNKKHGITPASIEKQITDISVIKQKNTKNIEKILSINLYADPEDLEEEISKKVKEMHKTALNFEYEKAAGLRDEIAELRKELATKYER
ncbi:UvrB/UvrC motif-containing protein, partial [Patescibacteria group bacterium]|nr:UvrB/UvrC motif-containing protein [Patescibacteria group bacterium]